VVAEIAGQVRALAATLDDLSGYCSGADAAPIADEIAVLARKCDAMRGIVAEPDEDGRQIRVTRGSQIVPERLEWWEPGLVLKASVNLLAAREGKGKSTVTSSWAARESHNGGNVLWIGTEESRTHIQVPRLIAAGADMDRVVFVDVETELGTGSLVFPLDLDRVERVIAEHNITMMVLDPCKGLVPAGFSGNDDIAVRQYLEPIAAMVARRNIVFLGVAHFGKRESSDSGKLLLGSVAWSQIARCVLSIAEDPDTGTRVLTNTKSNYSPESRSVEFSIVNGVTVPGSDIEWGSVHWLGDTTTDARDLLSSEGQDEDASDRTAAENWLEDYLMASGATPSKVVKNEARKEGISERTLKRAKQKLGVIDSSAGFPRVTIWELPSRATTSPQTPVSCEAGPTGPTGPDQQEQDGPTGPDSQSGHAHETGPTGGPTDGPTVPLPSVMPRQLHVPAPKFTPSRQRERSRGKHRPPLCPDCQRAPARSDTDRCDFCTARHQKTVATA